MTRAPIAALLALLMSATLAHAVQPDEVMRDPALEARARDAEARAQVSCNDAAGFDDQSARQSTWHVAHRQMDRDRYDRADSATEVADSLPGHAVVQAEGDGRHR